MVDPTGEAELHWLSKNHVQMTVRYTVDDSRAKGGFTPAQAAAVIAEKFSGHTTIDGQVVTITASAEYIPLATSAGVADLKTVTVFPVGQLPHTETGGRPYVADGIGGSQVHVTPEHAAPQIAHELGGHTSGAGDQYFGGIGADGQRVRTPGPGENVMQNYRRGANAQTLREIVKAPTNPNTCADGVTSITGAC